MDIPNDKNVQVVIDKIRDMKDDISTQRNQLGFLLKTQVERQRAECSTKLIMKNFWKYWDGANQSLLRAHRETIFRRIDRQCHLQSEEWTVPFTLHPHWCQRLVVQTGRHGLVQERNLGQRLVLYIHEWSAQGGMLHLQSGPGSLEHINGKIKIEPCIGTIKKLQREPLKAAMTALSNIATANGVFQHSGQNLTIQKKDSIDHMLWVALGHLYGFYSGQFLETSTCGWRWSLGLMSGLWTSTTASAGTIWHHCTTTARRSWHGNALIWLWGTICWTSTWSQEQWASRCSMRTASRQAFKRWSSNHTNMMKWNLVNVKQWPSRRPRAPQRPKVFWSAQVKPFSAERPWDWKAKGKIEMNIGKGISPEELQSSGVDRRHQRILFESRFPYY